MRFNIKSKNQLFVIIFLLTLPLFNPGYLNQFVWTDRVINVLRVISFCIIVGLYIDKIRKQKKVQCITICIFLIWAYLWVITLIHGGIILDCAKLAFEVFGIIILYEVFGNYDRETFLSSQLLCFEIVIYINLATEILFPQGLYTLHSETSYFVSDKCWFIGYYNQHTKIFIPALMIAFLYAEQTGKKVRTYLLSAAIWVSALIVWSGGVLLSLFAVTIVYIFFKDYTKVFNYYNYWLLQILFFMGVICFKFQNLFY